MMWRKEEVEGKHRAECRVQTAGHPLCCSLPRPAGAAACCSAQCARSDAHHGNWQARVSPSSIPGRTLILTLIAAHLFFGQAWGRGHGRGTGAAGSGREKGGNHGRPAGDGIMLCVCST